MSAAAVSPETTPVTGENPFKFLDYYDEKDEQIFAGRSEEIATILAEFAYGATYVLYGRSGLGKTSLVKAGVIPRMVDIGYLPVYIRILDDPEAELLQKVREKLDRPDLGLEELPRVLSSVPSNDPDSLDDTTVTPVALIFDQFEEFFIRFRDKPAVRKSFATLLGKISRAGGAAVRIIFSLREDYLAQLNDLRPQLPDILNRSHRLLPLTAIGAREAILAILRHHRVEYDDAVPGLLVKQLEPHGFNPLVLQIFCSEVYEAAKKRDSANIELRSEDVSATGTVEAVYMRYLEAVTKGLPSNRVLLACCMLDILRTAEQTKRVLRVKDIAVDDSSDTPFAVYFNVTKSDAESMLEYLWQQRVVRRLPTKESWYELLHDGIVPVLTEWLTGKKEFRSFRDADRLVDNLHVMEDSFLSEKQLRQAVDPFQQLLRLTKEEISYLFRSSVYEKGESVAYWATLYDQAFGEGASTEVIAQAIKNPETVLAGLAAAGRVRQEKLADACLMRAFHDAKPEVRRAAGAAYAQIGVIDYGAMDTGRRYHGTRRNVIELMADLVMHGHKLKQMGRITRWRIDRIVKQRQLSAGAELIRNRTTTATAVAAVGALFVAAGLLPAAYLLISVYDANNRLSSYAGAGFGVVIGVILISLYVTRRAAARVAREAVLRRSEHWSSRALEVWELDLAIAAVGTWVVLAGSDQSQLTSRWVVHVVPVALILWTAILGLREAWRGFRASSREFDLSWRAAMPLAALGGYALAVVMKIEAVASLITAVVIARVLTGPAMRLVPAILHPFSGMITVGVRTIQLTYLVLVLPILVTLMIPLSAFEQPVQEIINDVRQVLTLAAIFLGLRTPVAFALAWAGKQFPLASEGLAQGTEHPQRQRSTLLLRLAMPLTIALALFAYGTDFSRLFGEEEKTGTEIRRSFPRYWTRTHHMTIVPRNGEFAVVDEADVQGEAGIKGLDSTSIRGRAVTARRPLKIALTNQNTIGKVTEATLVLKERPILTIADAAIDKNVLVEIKGECRGSEILFRDRGRLPDTGPEYHVVVYALMVLANGRTYDILRPTDGQPIEIGSDEFESASSLPVPLRKANGIWEIDQKVRTATGGPCASGPNTPVRMIGSATVEPYYGP